MVCHFHFDHRHHQLPIRIDFDRLVGVVVAVEAAAVGGVDSVAFGQAEGIVGHVTGIAELMAPEQSVMVARTAAVVAAAAGVADYY